jgi:hypothetical protein
MTAPTKASRKEELALIKAELSKLTSRYREQGRALKEMTKRAEEAEQKLAPFLQWACKQCGCSFGHQRKEKDDEGVKYCSPCYSINVIAAQRDVARATLARIRAALRPVLDYFGEQWVGDRVRKEYRELVQFVKEGGNE